MVRCRDCAHIHQRGSRMPGPGRPSLGERVPLGLRVTLDTKARLDAAARYNGRSLSQEAEFRLEQSFDSDRLSRIEGLLHTLVAHIIVPKPLRERFDFEQLFSEFELVQKGQFQALKADGPFGALKACDETDLIRFCRLLNRDRSLREGDDRS